MTVHGFLLALFFAGCLCTPVGLVLATAHRLSPRSSGFIDAHVSRLMSAWGATAFMIGGVLLLIT